MLSQYWGKSPFRLRKTDGTEFCIAIGGRERWALEVLMVSGPAGCAPLDHPGPRWSGYIFALRGLGIEIETRTERHGPPFEGNHDRYVLTSTVAQVEGGGV